MVENTVTRAELRAAVAAIGELVPAPNPDLDGQRLEEIAGRLNTVRMFLPALMRTVDFGATGEAKPVLAAMIGLADLLTEQRPRRVPACWLDARRIDHDLVTGGWQRLVYPAGRPEETVDRAAYAYTLCVLELFHRDLKYRNIFVEDSTKWRDPHAHLLSGRWCGSPRAGRA